jgi:hypothetical protein
LLFKVVTTKTQFDISVDKIRLMCGRYPPVACQSAPAIDWRGSPIIKCERELKARSVAEPVVGHHGGPLDQKICVEIDAGLRGEIALLDGPAATDGKYRQVLAGRGMADRLNSSHHEREGRGQVAEVEIELDMSREDGVSMVATSIV